MENLLKEDKSIIVLREQVKTSVVGYEQFKVSNTETLDQAIVVRKGFLNLKREIAIKEKTATDPIKAGLEVVRGWFKPMREAVETADRYYYGQIMDWQEKKYQEEKKKVQELEVKVKSGKISLEEAEKKIEKVEEKRQAIPTREITKVRITDFSKLSDEYKLPNEAKIKEDILAGKKVVGAEIYKETIIVNR